MQRISTSFFALGKWTLLLLPLLLIAFLAYEVVDKGYVGVIPLMLPLAGMQAVILAAYMWRKQIFPAQLPTRPSLDFLKNVVIVCGLGMGFVAVVDFFLHPSFASRALILVFIGAFPTALVVIVVQEMKIIFLEWKAKGTQHA